MRRKNFKNAKLKSRKLPPVILGPPVPDSTVSRRENFKNAQLKSRKNPPVILGPPVPGGPESVAAGVKRRGPSVAAPSRRKAPAMPRKRRAPRPTRAARPGRPAVAGSAPVVGKRSSRKASPLPRSDSVFKKRMSRPKRPKRPRGSFN